MTKLYYDDNDYFEGYGVNLFFNENLEYQGEYAYLGKLDADMGTSKFK